MESGKVEPKLLHYGALVPTRHITVPHIHQILGFGNHGDELIQKTMVELTALKKDVRAWAREQLKSKMTEIAKTMGSKENTARMLNKDNDIRSLAELKKWRSNPKNQKDALSRNSIYYALFGHYEECKCNDEELEDLYMKKFNLHYTEDSKKLLHDQCGLKGYKKKDCIAMNIAMVKAELVKQVQNAGKVFEEEMILTKNRPKRKQTNNSDKRGKKGMHYYKQLDKDHSPVKQCMENKVKHWYLFIYYLLLLIATD
jgi:hypothetical protein